MTVYNNDQIILLVEKLIDDSIRLVCSSDVGL